MKTLDTNFRYRGWRESSKLAGMVQCGLGDLTTLALQAMQQRYDYDNNVVNCTTTVLSSNVLNQYREDNDTTAPECFEDLEMAFQSIVQHARELAAFARRLL